MNVLQVSGHRVGQLRRAGTVLQRRRVQTLPSSPANASRPPVSANEKKTDQSQQLRRDIDLSHLDQFPSLLHPNPYLDVGLTYEEPPNWANPHPLRLTIHGLRRQFWPIDPSTGRLITPTEQKMLEEGTTSETDETDDETDGQGGRTRLGLRATIGALPRSIWAEGYNGVMGLHTWKIWSRRAVKQGGRGKKQRQTTLLLVGNGDGLIGWGDGKHEQPRSAREASFRESVYNLDRVDRFENRTIWHETTLKFGATTVVLRPRPLGFGLRCGPIMHQVCKLAGIKDISGKIYGSHNRMNVMKATCLALWHGGARPLMGDGVGGGGRRLEKGQGVRNRDDIERARGRSLLRL